MKTLCNMVVGILALSVVASPAPAVAEGDGRPAEIQASTATREPINIGAFELCPANGFGCQMTVYSVPKAKRLVIEYVSIILTDTVVADTIAPQVQTNTNGRTLSHELGTTSEITRVGGLSNIVMGKRVKFYADPETDVSVNFRRALGQSTFRYGFNVKLSGYLETVAPSK